MEQDDLFTLELNMGIAQGAEVLSTEDIPVFYEHHQTNFIALGNIKGNEVEFTVFDGDNKEKLKKLKPHICAFLVGIKLESNGFRITKVKAIGISICAKPINANVNKT